MQNNPPDTDQDTPVAVPETPSAAPRRLASQELDPASADLELAGDDEDASLPLEDLPLDGADGDDGDVVPEGPLAVGRAAIEHAVRHAPTSPGVYRMLNAASDVLYVGKAKNIRKRLSSYARPT
ncbi:MAG: Excinuclease subunit, partial [Tardiphaga sp.]|nr:Excinuclease subunit [Tardiphaga sp.]